MEQAAKPRFRAAKARRLPAAGLAAMLIALGVLASACSGGSPTGSAGTLSSAQAANRAVAFSVCMRAHGVPNYADPHISSSGGGTQATVHGRHGAGGLNTTNRLPRENNFSSPRKPAQVGGPKATSHLSVRVFA